MSKFVKFQNDGYGGQKRPCFINPDSVDYVVEANFDVKKTEVGVKRIPFIVDEPVDVVMEKLFGEAQKRNGDN